MSVQSDDKEMFSVLCSQIFPNHLFVIPLNFVINLLKIKNRFHVCMYYCYILVYVMAYSYVIYETYFVYMMEDGTYFTDKKSKWWFTVYHERCIPRLRRDEGILLILAPSKECRLCFLGSIVIYYRLFTTIPP